MTTPVAESPQPLKSVLEREGLSYQDVHDLCPDHTSISAQTVADIATSRRRGSKRSRIRILNAVNKHGDGKRVYRWGDLYLEPESDFTN